nr:MAG TPA: helix-turn-helix domain protein [Caudoviricetes sp.]
MSVLVPTFVPGPPLVVAAPVGPARQPARQRPAGAFVPAPVDVGQVAYAVQSGPRRRPSCAMPLSRLVAWLRRQGWGALDAPRQGGLRSVVTALGDVLDDVTGEGDTTVEQVAAAAGLRERWTRETLGLLEDLGVITWRRGGVRYGRPCPSRIRMSKRTLCLLIEGAQETRTRALIEHAVRTRQRLAAFLRRRWLVRHRRPQAQVVAGPARPAPVQAGVAVSLGSVHAAASAYPSPVGGEPVGGSPHPLVSSAPSGDRTRPAAARPSADASGGGRRPLPSDSPVVRISRVEPMSNPPPAVAAARAAAAAAVAGCQERRRQTYERAVHPRVP